MRRSVRIALCIAATALLPLLYLLAVGHGQALSAQHWRRGLHGSGWRLLKENELVEERQVFVDLLKHFSIPVLAIAIIDSDCPYVAAFSRRPSAAASDPYLLSLSQDQGAILVVTPAAFKGMNIDEKKAVMAHEVRHISVIYHNVPGGPAPPSQKSEQERGGEIDSSISEEERADITSATLAGPEAAKSALLKFTKNERDYDEAHFTWLERKFMELAKHHDPPDTHGTLEDRIAALEMFRFGLEKK